MRVPGFPATKKEAARNVDLERTGCGDASACLSIVAHPVDVGRLQFVLVSRVVPLKTLKKSA
jgi:hypothetical protein